MGSTISIFSDGITPEAYALALGWAGWDHLRLAIALRGDGKCCCEDGKWTHFSDGVPRDCLICGGTGELNCED
jgi:hypothetical protein